MTCSQIILDAGFGIVWCRSAAKEETAEDGKKKKGGVIIPEEWPWEEAKQVFEKPDVTPADQIEV